MNKYRKLIIPALCAALIMSGCTESGKPAGTTTAAESLSTTAPAETTAAVSDTTAAAATTTTAGTTTTTTAEPEKPRIPVSIAAIANDDLKYNAKLTSNVHIDQDAELITDEFLEYGLTSYGAAESDKRMFFRYTLDDSTSRITENEGGRENLVISASAADIYVRASTCAFSESDKEHVSRRIGGENIVKAGEFPSAYSIQWDDPTVTLTTVDAVKPEYYDPVKNEEVRRYSEFNDLRVGWHTSDPVTVNAFVCEKEGGISVLIDPEYMYGLPMFRDSEYIYRFGKRSVFSDSLLFYAVPVEGLSLDTDAYAYAKVVLMDVSCAKSYGSISENTCTIADIEIIDTFDDIADYNISANDAVISSGDKDPAMQAVYDALLNNKDSLINDTTAGIVLLDLDYDGRPEVLVSELEGDLKESLYLAKNVLSVYTVEGDRLLFSDSIELKHMSADNALGFIGLSELPDGTPAWYLNGYDDNDYLCTFEGGRLIKHDLFTSAESSDPEKPDYFYFGEKIVPKVTMGKNPYAWDEPDAAEDWEYLEWNGINATFGLWELFGFARADYANNRLKATYPLYSGWLGEFSNVSEIVRYDLTERELAHKLAYLVDDFYYGGTPGVDHYFWFLGAYAKPVIYLYPEEQTDVSVRVRLPEDGELTCTYPEYGEGWKVTAMPDGTLYDENGDEYYCLYWEGTGAVRLNMSEGFCVRGEDTAAFLREKLMYIGLTAREANEFIIYWLPQMQNNPYNVITLHTADYAAGVPLEVSPAPAASIRVFMTFSASDEPVAISAQTLPHYERNGFTLVEWGGCAL